MNDEREKLVPGETAANEETPACSAPDTAPEAVTGAAPEAASDAFAESATEAAAAGSGEAEDGKSSRRKKKGAKGAKSGGDKEKEKEKKKKDRPKDVRTAAKRLISYITSQKGWLVLVAVLVVLATAVSACSSLIMQPVYSAIESVTVKGGDPNQAWAQILRFLVLMSVAYIIGAAMSFAYTRIMLSVSIRVLTNMRRELFNHLQTLPISYFDKHKTGEIMAHFTSDIGRVSDLVQNTFTSLISSFIQAIVTITIMIYYSWQITLTITGSIALMMLTVLIITSKTRPLFKKQQETMARCNGYIEEYVRGIKVVKIFSHEETAKKEFSDINEEYRRYGVKANIISGFMGPIMSMIVRLNYAIAVTIGASMIIKKRLTVPKLITYLQYVASYGSPVASIAASYSTLISALAGAERVFAVLDIDSETDEGRVTLVKTVKDVMGYDVELEDGKVPENASVAEDAEVVTAWKVTGGEDGSVSYVPVACEVDVSGVDFAYVEDKPVLKNVSAHAAHGEKAAFVGSTGAGKTTITNLINRFYEIEKGSISIDGIDIRDIKKSDLRSVMAFVLQDTKLFAGTIAENIRYGKLDATDEEVEAAARIANAHSFIEKLPDKYETKIRSDGVNISVGQAQLINIARAAISGRPLLVLDEATSSVDTRTERLIEKGMDSIMADKTVLVIAHRLSTVRNSNEIYVLEGGEVIEQGTHDQLIALGQKYYQLYTGAYEMT